MMDGEGFPVGSLDGHQEIVDLIEQIQHLQDQQVAGEARFITLDDDSVEQIGVDFDIDGVDRAIGDSDPAVTPDPPSEDEIVRALEHASPVEEGLPFLHEQQFNNVRIVSEFQCILLHLPCNLYKK